MAEACSSRAQARRRVFFLFSLSSGIFRGERRQRVRSASLVGVLWGGGGGLGGGGFGWGRRRGDVRAKTSDADTLAAESSLFPLSARILERLRIVVPGRGRENSIPSLLSLSLIVDVEERRRSAHGAFSFPSFFPRSRIEKIERTIGKRARGSGESPFFFSLLLFLSPSDERERGLEAEV